MMSSILQSEITSANEGRVQDWPRDFDVRAEYAEQQELLAQRYVNTATVINLTGTECDD
ncbi:hypothetical protein D3C73_1222950 [compost metagenome]